MIKTKANIIIFNISIIITSLLMAFGFDWLNIYSNIGSILGLLIFSLIIIFFTRMFAIVVTAFLMSLFLSFNKKYKSEKYLNWEDYNLAASGIITLFILEEIKKLYILDILIQVIIVIFIFIIVHYLNENIEY